MASEWQEVLQSLHALGFTSVRWAVIGAKHAGSPMERLRWFCVANKEDLGPWFSGQLPPVHPDSWNEFSKMRPPSDWFLAQVC